MNTLWDLVQQAPRGDAADTIYARRPWTKTAAAILVRISDDNRPSVSVPEGYTYFLEISICRELHEDVADRKLSPQQWFDLILHYAEHDA